jgi:ribonuclease D
MVTASQLPDGELPAPTVPSSGPPPARSWPDKDPLAARRLALVKDELATLSERESIPVENLMTPDLVRRVLWSPPFEPGVPADQQREILLAVLRDGGARTWQIAKVADVLMTGLNYTPELNTSED